MVDKAIMDSRWKPEKVFVLQRPQCEAELNLERDLDWQQEYAQALLMRVFLCLRQILFIFSIPLAQQGNRKVWCVIMVVTP